MMQLFASELRLTNRNQTFKENDYDTINNPTD